MTENSLHKCEHHACKHSDTPGIVLCPEFDSTFLKRAAVGWKLPLPVHASFIQTAPQVSEGALRKTQLPLPPCVQFAIPRRTRGVKRGSNNGRLCAEVRQVFFSFFFASQSFFPRPQLEASRLIIHEPGKRGDCGGLARRSAQRCLE